MINTILLQAQADGGSGMMNIIMIVALIVIFYFFLIRPQQKRQKKIREEREKLEKGSKVITSGGVYGTVRDVKEKVFVIEITKDVKISVDKNCVYPASDPETALQDAEQQKQNK